MFELLYAVLNVLQAFFSTPLIDEPFEGVNYSLTYGQIFIVCVVVGVVIALFLPKGGKNA